jgi:UDP-N-acetyl-2-amino-2-deoxyglucuronate dehydrogenase
MQKIAIVGAGAIADSHLLACLKFKDRCRVVALVDLYPAKAAEKAAKYGLDVAVFQDCAALLNGCAFDAASICLPPFEHAPAALSLLRAGKHVLVEKPMATCLQECDAMMAAAAAAGKLLGVVAQNRFKTPMMRLKRVLESGLLGRILHAQVDSFWWRGSNYYDLWWRGTWAKEGGGCTMNHAVHHIDLFHWMMGAPAEVLAITANLTHENSEVEDFSTALLTYPNGRLGQITASLVHHGEAQQMVFQAEHARVAVPWSVQAMQQKENGFPEDNRRLGAEIQSFYERLPALEHEGHDGQIANFLEAIEGREPLLVDGAAGRRTLELISAIYQSAHVGRRVKLPFGPENAFYTRDGILTQARRFHQKTKNLENFTQNEITLGRNLGAA